LLSFLFLTLFIPRYCIHCWEEVSAHRPHSIVKTGDEGGGRMPKAAAESAGGKNINTEIDEQLFNYSTRDFKNHPKQVVAQTHKGNNLLDTLNEKYVVRAFEGLEGGGDGGDGELDEDYELSMVQRGDTAGRTGYREIEGVPSGATKISIEEKDRLGARDQVKNGVNVNVYKGRNFMSNGHWQVSERSER